MTHKEVLSEHD
jgi:hypothetical protein